MRYGYILNFQYLQRSHNWLVPVWPLSDEGNRQEQSLELFESKTELFQFQIQMSIASKWKCDAE